jgi:molybdenum cofactor biosynthesis enzyme MoaA
MDSKTFCVLPWIHLATNASGNLRVCCNSIPGKNFVVKDDGKPYKLNKDNLQEAWNSEVYLNIRKQMLNGNRPDMCERCFREEDAGINSARQAWNEKWKEEKEYTMYAPFYIQYIDIRLGNLCNLKCRMCNPYSSNMWVKEWHLVNHALDTTEYERLSKMNWPEDEKTWENLFSIAHTVEEIYLTGGEPTIIKEQHKLLDYFIEQNTAKDIKLKYNTNLTNVPKNLIDKWKNFKKVQLNCSIDAIEELDRYIRYPSNWKKIQENFNKIVKLKNVKAEIHCTVQMYNILHLNKLIEWSLPYNVKIYFNILNHPEELNIRVLPNDLKKLAEKRLQPYFHLEKVNGIIDYMWAEDWSDKMSKFIFYTKELDKSRNENLIKIVPEFANYIL